MTPAWPFADPPNVAVFTLGRILEKREPILQVFHDDDDGGWQFLDGKPISRDEAKLVSLRQMLQQDPTLAQLADLPLGWMAVRSGPESAWERSRQPKESE